MARMAVQDPALTGLVLVVAVQTLASKAKAISVVLISRMVKEINSSNLVIRVIRSS